jgi:predicted nuclease of predicted toxin-antitoxin system
LKLLLDENIGRSTSEALRRQGHDVSWIGGDSAGTADPAIMAQAEREGRVVVTKDKDFGELAFKNGQAHKGVILLRLADERPENTLSVILGVLHHLAHRKPPFFVVASDTEFRLHASRPAK